MREAITFESANLGHLTIDDQLGFSDGAQGALVGLQEFLKDPAPFFKDDLSRKQRRLSERETQKIRTDCKQSDRISGTTPTGCACAHPLEERPPDRGGRQVKKKTPNPIHNLGQNLGDFLSRSTDASAGCEPPD